MVTTKYFSFIGAALLLFLFGCANDADGMAACLLHDNHGGTLIVDVTNILDHPIEVSRDSTRVGCCVDDDFSIQVIDKDGAELRRCGYLDSFGISESVALGPGDAVTYSYSASSLTAAYCDADLQRYRVRISYGRPGSPRGRHFALESQINSCRFLQVE